ncbi:MAG: MBL fold metallo-hydrolase [Candidatus Heimdallarchaeaceae archaeon]|jgi:L-ascorbate metabolism protein UlaG (beta-lactamase superfamily)
MSFLVKYKLAIIITLGSLVAVAGIVTPTVVVLTNRDNTVTVTLTLLNNAGVMIEAKGLRIYVDPVDLFTNYSDYPSDGILITHEHGDHYQGFYVNLLSNDDTVIAFPAIMTSAISSHDGIGVVPGDSFMVSSINVTCFYMYTFPVNGYDASHPREYNYTSYIIDIDGFTIFHAGDTKDLPEYTQLTGKIDVALLPMGPGCQTMVDMEIVDAINMINPDYYIPIHFDSTSSCTSWQSTFGSYVTDCEILILDNYESYVFEI